MTDDELEALLEDLEAGLLADVSAALALTAQDFADRLDAATELTAARFSVSGIRDMWRRRVSDIMTRLRSITGRAAEVAAEDTGVELPEDWDKGLDGYWAPTRELLDAVGDRLAAQASQSLADGLNAGEGIDQLKARLAALFATEGTQLGAGRADRIATTEATRAFNAGTLAAAEAMTGPDRPLVKQWLTRRDRRVRDAHADTNGQLRLLNEPFDVDGTEMQYPGDPTAPAALTVNCRCVLRTSAPVATAPGEGNDMTDDLAAAADVHTGAMLALMPTEADAQRLALEGGEATDQLHLTLAYLGNAVDWTAGQQGDLISRVSFAARYLTPVAANVFGAAQWNPQGDEPAWVWNVGNDNDATGSRLEDAKYEITYALEDGYDDPELPQQHTPWVPHICAVYSADNWSATLAEKVGPVSFDRIRVAFAGQYTDIPLSGGYADELADVDYTEPVAEELAVDAYEEPPLLLTWSTPGDTALAFENQQTGDGRIFAPGSLYWEGGPWPLQYADEMNGGHDGARLAGAIFGMGRDLPRITGDGVLYLTQPAGVEAALLLAQGAPLGASVDLDDVDLEMSVPDDSSLSDGAQPVYSARLVTASLLPLPDGGWHLTGETATEWTASSSATVGESSRMDFVIGADGRVPAAAFQLTEGAALTAAAGDPDAGGTVVERQLSGDVLMRITKARVRGATLVTIPAYADARIVLDNPGMVAAATAATTVALTASAAGSDYDRVVRHVRKALIPVTAGDTATFLRVPVGDVRRYLARAAKKGTIVRIAHGRYVAPVAAATASASGADLQELAASGWNEEGPVSEEMEASAWSAMRDLPAMPATWFAAPTDAELPPGGPGVNYKDGRVFGWVAQAGEPHAGYAKKVTIDSLGHIDTSHFLRQRFTLDDGSTVKAGAFTMNVGHHRDGAECETASCQFDDTRTVAGIVTVGMSSRGMWFSGAAAPWMSEWDRNVFAASQPSYHLKRGASGAWQLRAVLSVPVPGHSSPLLASAVVDRSNLALTASATMLEVEEAVAAATETVAAEPAPVAGGFDYERLVDSMVAAIERADARRAAETAELAALIAEAGTLDVTTGTERV